MHRLHPLRKAVKEKKIKDFALLSRRSLKKMVRNQSHHLMRRPAVDLSGTLKAGADVGPAACGGSSGGGGGAESTGYFNALDANATRDEVSVAKALETLEATPGGKDGPEEMTVKRKPTLPAQHPPASFAGGPAGSRGVGMRLDLCRPTKVCRRGRANLATQRRCAKPWPPATLAMEKIEHSTEAGQDG